MLERIVPLAVTHSLDMVESGLESDVIGQQIAIRFVVDGLYSSISGITTESETRMPPIANYLFLGPTGVGKTHFAEMLAKHLSEYVKSRVLLMKAMSDEEILTLSRSQAATAMKAKSLSEEQIGSRKWCKFISIDGSHFSEQHAISELLGSPRGYAGSDRIPIFNSRDFNGEDTVVLLIDEVEKAIDHVFGRESLDDIMLNVMENGIIQNRRGETVNFGSTIIIMTSNLGIKEVMGEAKGRSIGFALTDPGAGDTEDRLDKINQRIHELCEKKAKDTFKPEFINRLTKVVTFRFLSDDDFRDVLKLTIAALETAIANQFRGKGQKPPKLLVSEKAENLILSQGISREFGARQLKRKMDRKLRVGNRDNGYHGLDYLMATGSIVPGEHVYVFVDGEVAPDGRSIGSFSEAARLLESGILRSSSPGFKIVDRANLVFYRRKRQAYKKIVHT